MGVEERVLSKEKTNKNKIRRREDKRWDVVVVHT